MSNKKPILLRIPKPVIRFAFAFLVFPISRVVALMPFRRIRYSFWPMIADYDFARRGRLPRESRALALIQQSVENPVDSMFAGVTVNFAHSVIGMHCLNRQDLAGARQALLDSVSAPTVPTLGAAGPSFVSLRLAERLLEAEEHKTVLTYLDRLKELWTLDSAPVKVNRWVSAIRRGEIPRLRRWN